MHSHGAEREGDVVGFMILTEGNIEALAQIQLIGVEKSKRGHGIGKELVKSAVAHVSSLKQVKLKLFTRPWNIGMSKVCIDLGFIPEAYLKKDYLGEDLVLYSYFIV
jgi:RimJ/RimL family protein N-acetyltransferase